MKIIILNYQLGCVDVVTLPVEYGVQTEEIEERLTNLGFKLSQISWMASRNEGTPVFYNKEEYPVYTL